MRLGTDLLPRNFARFEATQCSHPRPDPSPALAVVVRGFLSARSPGILAQLLLSSVHAARSSSAYARHRHDAVVRDVDLPGLPDSHKPKTNTPPGGEAFVRARAVHCPC